MKNKEEILTRSYEILKNDINNKEQLTKIVNLMLNTNVNVAIEMWKELAKIYRPQLANNGYWLSEEILKNINNGRLTDIRFVEKLSNDSVLMKYLFATSSVVGKVSMNIVITLIYTGNFEKVNELLGYLHSNKNNREYNFGTYLFDVIKDINYDKISNSELFAVLLSEWSTKVTDQIENAKINVALVELLSNIEEKEEHDINKKDLSNDDYTVVEFKE